jgi:patatin-like phospholipase/acyl hydrolase
VKIVSIDGGGIRGLIPAMVLAEIEKRSGKPVAELADLIVGTSTGGILGAALAGPQQHSAESLTELYLSDGPKIFHRSLLKRVTSVEGLLDERYDNAALRESLAEHLGTGRLSQVRTGLFVTAYELRLRQAFFFRSSRAQGRDLPAGAAADEYDFALTDVALATSSAPTYFEPVEARSGAGVGFALIDGGVFATNPAMCAYAEARRTGRADDLLVVSLGTGTQTHEQAISLEDAQGWGQLGWARTVINVMFDGVAETVDHELTQLGGVTYMRLQRGLSYAREALDDASAENLANLQKDARALIEERSQDIDDACSALA